MANAAAPPAVTTAGGTHAAPPTWRIRLLRAVSTRWSLRVWYGGIVGFFLVMVLLPTLFVLGYVLADWSTVGSVLADPSKTSLIPSALWLSFGVALTVAAFDLLAGLLDAGVIDRTGLIPTARSRS